MVMVNRGTIIEGQNTGKYMDNNSRCLHQKVVAHFKTVMIHWAHSSRESAAKQSHQTQSDGVFYKSNCHS
jgi:hypothetical protein